MTDRYLVAVASYRRPSSLEHLLDSLVGEVGGSAVEVLVVDNDAEETARAVATGHRLRPTYVVEAEPGIAAARNRALAHFDDTFRAIIFVDDDEWVAPGWFSALTGYARRTGADVVQGAVVSEVPETAPAWIVRAGFIQRAIHETGHRLDTAATNNTLLRRDAWVRAGAPTFDPAFSASGGSDFDFFWGLRSSGARIVFCAEAVVHEEVPSDRLTLRWVRRRAVRNGIAQSRSRRKHHDRSVAWLAGSALNLLRASVVLAIGIVAGRGVQAKPFNQLFVSYGRLAALVNRRILEYARPPDPAKATHGR